MYLNCGLKYIHITCIYMYSHHLHLTIILQGRAGYEAIDNQLSPRATLMVRALPFPSRTQLKGRTLTMNPAIV